MPIRFDWDPRKDRRNGRKHGVGFDEASTIFADTLSITVPDSDHSDDEEERWVTMGFSHRQRLLVVVHTADEQETVRIIRACPTDPDERREYEEGRARRR